MKNLPWWLFFSGVLAVLVVLPMFMYKKKIKELGTDILLTRVSYVTEEEYRESRFQLSRPVKEYKKPSGQKFPLVVYLHSGASRGTDNRKQIRYLDHLGIGFSLKARTFREKYPCFVYVPQCPNGLVWEGQTLTNVIDTIEHLKASYPIDPQRLYLIGYSMGGSGVYALAERYYTYNHQLFAGIVRIAGQSFFDRRVHNIVSKSAVWLHIGLRDASLRVDRAREAFKELKKIHGNPKEQIQEFDENGQRGRTFTLLTDQWEKVKLTEYPDLGHGIPHIPFDYQDVMMWLFSQKTTEH
jgi:predicted peptidase